MLALRAMTTKTPLLQRLKLAVETRKVLPKEDVSESDSPSRVVEVLRDRLSGALETQVKVKEWVDGGIRCLIPMSALAATGLKVVESAISGLSPILAGNDAAVSSAERCVAKRVGEGYTARLIGFDAPTRRGIFELEHGAETPST
jgi:hypothetical protein